jgi:hypothetical protein
MDKVSRTVFAQAEALWTPEAGVMRQAFDLRREGIDRKASANGEFGSGNRILAQAKAAAAEVEARGAKVLECLLEATRSQRTFATKAARPTRSRLGTARGWVASICDSARGWAQA